MDITKARVQHVSGGKDPHVVAPDGTRIPIPPSIGSGKKKMAITSKASIRVAGSAKTYYYVSINIPSRLSGDGRMLALAAGFGSFKGAASAGAKRAGFGWLVKTVAGQIVGRFAGAALGVFLPNRVAGDKFIRKQLANGAKVVYCVIY